MMARGWESKSVEEQLAEAEENLQDGTRRKMSPEEIQRAQKRRGIELALAKINSDLAVCANERHRAMLEAGKQELEKQLAALQS
jgi:hypothetical protein